MVGTQEKNYIFFGPTLHQFREKQETEAFFVAMRQAKENHLNR
jgi:hypothetical protein